MPIIRKEVTLGLSQAGEEIKRKKSSGFSKFIGDSNSGAQAKLLVILFGSAKAM